MDKHIILSRGKSGAADDWYEKGRNFLASNGCNDLAPAASSALFKEAVASISALSGGSVQVDDSADVFIVTAKLGGSLSADECRCECGYSGACGGGGGGGGKMALE